MHTQLVFILKALLALALLYAAYLLVLLSVPYLAFKPGVDFLLTKQLIYHLDHWRISYYVHVFSSVTLVVCGLLQMSRRILQRTPIIHRTSGFIYLYTVMWLSGPSALVMSFYANGGIPAQTSFVSLSSVWLLVTGISWYYLRKRAYEQHGNFMLLSYMLTLSAVTLRFYAYLFDLFDIPLHPVDTYRVLAWISWIPNLIAGLVLIRLGFVRRLIS